MLNFVAWTVEALGFTNIKRLTQSQNTNDLQVHESHR